MVIMFVTHGVEDFDRWHEGYKASIAGMDQVLGGLISEQVHRSTDGKSVMVTHTFADEEGAKNWQRMMEEAGTPELMAELGIVLPMQMWITEAV